jgi:hypothetical protein
MKSVYILKDGVELWEKKNTNQSIPFFYTITVLARSTNDFEFIWNSLKVSFDRIFSKAYRWTSFGFSFDSKIQERRVVEGIIKKLKLYNHLLKKNEKSGIFSYIKEIGANFDFENLSSISDGKYSALIFVSGADTSVSELWEEFKIVDTGIDINAILKESNLKNSILICRVYEVDSHSVLQFFGRDCFIRKICNLLVGIGLQEISEGNTVGYINGHKV